ncbi:hypothetical protein [Listeria booriae]|uniref:Uncharacterized protein n=1 Tax=Listeria booriae TaxID=1552123 RepID=A0A7X0ZWX9_9LIST|nr:hypothetical protein [Listeria booriae]MBC1780540.1 hypothetical protein [Listeria booriae]MBC2080884.1 hypothetical protein [Listeria booriae]MBC2305831.1 hypothetical protein [Listeria booriae]MBC2312064.1 hypothetical protein [Listeria booriae]MBC6164698.1 hypothetical protein [Listeria booriae]
MSGTHRRNLYVNQETNDFINEACEERGVSPGKFVDYLVQEYQRMKQTELTGAHISELISDNVHQTFDDAFKRLQMSENRIDKKTSILVEMMNGIYIKQEDQSCATTDIFASTGYEQAKEKVEKDIDLMRRNKLDWQHVSAGGGD